MSEPDHKENTLEIPVKALLESFDPSALRKTRKRSFITLRANSCMNLNSLTDDRDSEVHLHTTLLTPGHGEGGHGHGHHEPKKTNQREATVMSLSALYGKILIVIGIAFPIAQSFAPDLPLIYYDGFYLYLYVGSIIFVLYAYFFVLTDFTASLYNVVLYTREIGAYIRPFLTSLNETIVHNFRKVCPKSRRMVDDKSEMSSTVEPGDLEDMHAGEDAKSKSKYVFTESAGHGSMYLKTGTIVFGIGSMIYSGLEFGQYFELRKDCSDILMAITPAARMVFTFLQMYFIFLNSRVSISNHSTIARFGIMHMVATNLCIWLNVLVEETKHSIHLVTHGNGHHDEHHEIEHDLPDDDHQSAEHHENDDILINPADMMDLMHHDAPAYPSLFAPKISENLFDPSMIAHNLVRRFAEEEELEDCRMINLMGDMVSSAAPLLFPCTIEYSLLCASVLYVMWNNIQVEDDKKKKGNKEDEDLSHFIARKVRHLYSVDCGRASRGLFTGIFVLVLTLISLIIFYVLISHPEFQELGMFTANITEIIIYSIGIVTTIIGMVHLRELGFVEEEETELDNILLVIAQGGVYMFTIFTLVGGYFSKEASSKLPLFSAAFMLIQATLQTMYILDGSRRCCKTKEQLKKKSGRELVTFLLVINLSMWLMSTFQTSRAELHAAQQDFYGIWAWTIISHVSMPLGIFYRFHVTVCLGDMWKKVYKLRSD